MQWDEVTWYSRLGAMIFFIGVIPLLMFYIGMRYGQITEMNKNVDDYGLYKVARQNDLETSPDRPAFDGRNTTFTIEGSPVTLINGVSEVPVAPDSVSTIRTRYFGNEAVGDLNGDGNPDSAFIITQETGGSGIFYYIVAALQTTEGYEATNAIFLGDRIAPQTTAIRDGTLVVNYAEREADEALSTEPSVGVSMRLIVQNELIITP